MRLYPRAATKESADEFDDALFDRLYGVVKVVACNGFENWSRSERERDLFDFLHAMVNGNGALFISSLITLTEDEREQYESVAV
ncbi:hypothetical protein HUU05_14530 [candidate division KSB1 bacterium]|nr:hypothetical protein [candidate division KSB1 bacterium]